MKNVLSRVMSALLIACPFAFSESYLVVHCSNGTGDKIALSDISRITFNFTNTSAHDARTVSMKG